MKVARKTTAASDDGECGPRTADWRSGSGYPPEAASGSGFAWQFLRRNPGYRADWQCFVDDLRTLAKESAEWADLVRWRLDDDSAKYAVGSIRMRRGAWQTPLESKLASKWGLTALTDPNRSVPADGVPSWELAAGQLSFLRWSFEADQQQTMALEQPSQLIVRVDLRVPRERLIEAITKQIDRARDELRIEASERRSRSREWITYLRILDADETGAADEEICAAIWPHLSNAYPERRASKRLDKARRAARALRDGGYRLLPLLEAANKAAEHRRK